MKKKMISLMLSVAMLLTTTSTAFAGSTTEVLSNEIVDKSTQPRIIITSDLEADDLNGLMLSLMYSTDYDLAGIIWTSGMFHFNGDGTGVTTITDAIKQYYVYDGSEKGGDENLYQPKLEANHTDGITAYDYKTGEMNEDIPRTLPENLTEWRPVDPDVLNHIVDLYEADYPNLVANNPNYPDASYIRSIAKVGNIEFEGDYRNDTEGSNLIKSCILDDDMRPLYIQHWGGSNTTIRALYSIYEDYHNVDGTAKAEWDSILAKVISKVRYSSTGEDNCWIYSKVDEMFPGLQQDSYHSTCSIGNYWKAVTAGDLTVHIALEDGTVLNIKEGTNETLNPYYRSTYLKDAFKFNHGKLLGEFHLMGDGNIIYGEPIFFQYGITKTMDWRLGGKYGFAEAYDETSPYYTFDQYDWMGCQFGCNAYVDFGLRQDVMNTDEHYVEVLFDDLAARADWAIEDAENCNHAPNVAAETPDLVGNAGEIIALSGNASDPDSDDNLSVKWWIPYTACTYKAGEATEEELEALSIADTKTSTAQFQIPADAQAGDKFVINMEVSDDAERPMTRFAQYVITVEESALASQETNVTRTPPETGDNTIAFGYIFALFMSIAMLFTGIFVKKQER